MILAALTWLASVCGYSAGRAAARRDDMECNLHPLRTTQAGPHRLEAMLWSGPAREIGVPVKWTTPRSPWPWVVVFAVLAAVLVLI